MALELTRKLRMGMVGGGRGAFIGAVHRMAARLDGHIDLVAGCFSSNPEKSKASGEDFYVDPSRVYSDFTEMAEKEAALPEDQRIDFVSVVTPNSTHVPAASAFLKAGIHVVCDKPLSTDLKSGLDLRDQVHASGKVFALTHNYTGYPMVKQARQMVADGAIGDVIKVVAEYPQGWMADLMHSEIGDMGNWRADPKLAGSASATGDIGTHAENLGRYITGLHIESLCAEFSTHIPKFELEDDANMLLRYRGGAKGVLFASQVSHGDENNLNIRVYGTKASLQWFQEHPNELLVRRWNQATETWRRGNDYVGDVAKKYSRIPFGHPEAFIEAFANIYLSAADSIAEAVGIRKTDTVPDHDFPNIEDGVEGMAFIETAVASAKAGAVWTPMPDLQAKS